MESENCQKQEFNKLKVFIKLRVTAVYYSLHIEAQTDSAHTMHTWVTELAVWESDSVPLDGTCVSWEEHLWGD